VSTNTTTESQPPEETDDTTDTPATEESAEDSHSAGDDGAPTDYAEGEHVEGDDSPGRTRRRTRVRQTGPADDGEAAREPQQPGQPPDSDEVAGEAGPSEEVRYRRRRRTGSGGKAPADSTAAESDAPGGSAKAGGDTASQRSDEETEAAPTESPQTDEDGGQRKGGSRSRRRGRGGRKGAGKQADAGDDAAKESSKDATKESSKGGGSKKPYGKRQGKGKGAGQTGGKPAAQPSRRMLGEPQERRMFVTVGEAHTQVAVLEDRDLVEHYVTRQSDESYVGNIYMGRVQNVLPGMEAAFIDIGKERNGVLYAGEVNYDEADLEEEVPRIEQTLTSGQPVLVQVTKDPMGTKGARLTQSLSVAGRYCVIAPDDQALGISRKLAEEERDRLRDIVERIRPEGYRLIVRTAAEGVTEEQLSADLDRLRRIWDQVETRAQQAKPMETVYEEPELVTRVIRDVFGPEYDELIVDAPELAERVRSYLSDVSPELVDRVRVHEGEEKLFDAYAITTQIRRAMEKKVWLPSGGYLIIEKTEAMWVIDVNTGRFTGDSNLEETVLRTNLATAEEITRQLRLRDMGGIVVIDYVDMLVPANRDEVLKRFKRELTFDRTKSRVTDISKLGLVQMTRKNVSQGVAESFTTVCECCEGHGFRVADQIV
jgi:ribonuclease E